MKMMEGFSQRLDQLASRVESSAIHWPDDEGV